MSAPRKMDTIGYIPAAPQSYSPGAHGGSPSLPPLLRCLMYPYLHVPSHWGSTQGIIRNMVERTNSDVFRQQVQAAFDVTGPAYGTPGDFHWPFAERLIHRAPLAPGQHVLDVATGTAPAAIM